MMSELSPNARVVKASITETTPPLSTRFQSLTGRIAFSLLKRNPSILVWIEKTRKEHYLQVVAKHIHCHSYLRWPCKPSLDSQRPQHSCCGWCLEGPKCGSGREREVESLKDQSPACPSGVKDLLGRT